MMADRTYFDLTADEQAAWKKEVGITETPTGFTLGRVQPRCRVCNGKVEFFGDVHPECNTYELCPDGATNIEHKSMIEHTGQCPWCGTEG